MFILSIAIYNFRTIPFKIPMTFSAEMKKRAASMSVRERRGEYMSYFIPVFIACSLLCASAGVGAVLTPLIVDFMN